MEEYKMENLGWCKPYRIKQNGKIAYFALNEGEIAGAIIDGKDYYVDAGEENEAGKALIEAFGEDYLEEAEELSCCDCAFYEDCEAWRDENDNEEEDEDDE
jgi:hypothetical protein